MPHADQIEIRRLTEQDAPAFYSLRLHALENEPGAFTEAPEEHRALTQDNITRLSSDVKGVQNIVLAASVEDDLIGMAGLSQFPGAKIRHKARLWGVYVKPEWRRKGVARVLVTELLERAKSIAGLEQVILQVDANHPAAKEFYSSLGFEVYGRDVHALKLKDGYVDEELMVLRITH